MDVSKELLVALLREHKEPIAVHGETGSLDCVWWPGFKAVDGKLMAIPAGNVFAVFGITPSIDDPIQTLQNLATMIDRGIVYVSFYYSGVDWTKKIHPYKKLPEVA